MLAVELSAAIGGETAWHHSGLIDAIGNADGSAMARLVSYPVAIAVSSVLEGSIAPGVSAAPSQPQQVAQWFSQLADLGERVQWRDHLAGPRPAPAIEQSGDCPGEFSRRRRRSASPSRGRSQALSPARKPRPARRRATGNPEVGTAGTRATESEYGLATVNRRVITGRSGPGKRRPPPASGNTRAPRLLQPAQSPRCRAGRVLPDPGDC